MFCRSLLVFSIDLRPLENFSLTYQRLPQHDTIFFLGLLVKFPRLSRLNVERLVKEQSQPIFTSDVWFGNGSSPRYTDHKANVLTVQPLQSVPGTLRKVLGCMTQGWLPVFDKIVIYMSLYTSFWMKTFEIMSRSPCLPLVFMLFCIMLTLHRPVTPAWRFS